MRMIKLFSLGFALMLALAAGGCKNPVANQLGAAAFESGVFLSSNRVLQNNPELKPAFALGAQVVCASVSNGSNQPALLMWSVDHADGVTPAAAAALNVSLQMYSVAYNSMDPALVHPWGVALCNGLTWAVATSPTMRSKTQHNFADPRWPQLSKLP